MKISDIEFAVESFFQMNLFILGIGMLALIGLFVWPFLPILLAIFKANFDVDFAEKLSLNHWVKTALAYYITSIAVGTILASLPAIVFGIYTSFSVNAHNDEIFRSTFVPTAGYVYLGLLIVSLIYPTFKSIRNTITMLGSATIDKHFQNLFVWYQQNSFVFWAKIAAYSVGIFVILKIWLFE